MDFSVVTNSTSINGEIPDRLTVSCPPETFTSSDDDLTENVPNSNRLQYVDTFNLKYECNGQREVILFHREIPERPGEISESRDDSRACSTLREDSEGEDGISTLETDKFGFFIRDNGISNLSQQPPIELKTLRRRENKWRQMLDNWRFFMDEKYTVVRDRCRKGIPPSMRGKAWKYLCGATYQMEVSKNRFVFENCMNQPANPRWIDDIEKDLNRQFPDHELFARNGKFGDGGLVY